MAYLFAAFTVTWLAFFIYNARLIRRVKKLEREAELLRGYLEEGEA